MTTETSLRVYLAARLGRRAEMRCRAAELGELGHEVTASWITTAADELTGASELEFLTEPAWWPVGNRIARQNVADIRRSDISLHFTDPPHIAYPFGARHVEFGLALAMPEQIKIVVGPREHLMHLLESPDVLNVATWDEVLVLLARAQERIRR